MQVWERQEDQMKLFSHDFVCLLMHLYITCLFCSLRKHYSVRPFTQIAKSSLSETDDSFSYDKVKIRDHFLR